uniref:Uncharacterized protein n=1 Tax=Arundo donax TaxID=35708 RepID=A0A0A9GPT0_ARUDO
MSSISSYINVFSQKNNFFVEIDSWFHFCFGCGPNFKSCNNRTRSSSPSQFQPVILVM